MAGRYAGEPSEEWLSLRAQESARLLAVRHKAGYIPEHELLVASDRLHRHPDTIRSYVTAEFGRPPPRTRKFEYDDWFIDLQFAYGGNVAEMHREAREAGFALPSLGSMYRAWNRVDAGIRDFATKGAKGYRNRLIYLRWEAQHRNAIWQADACELDVWVLSENGKTSVKPHLIIFLDDKWRIVTGWSVLFRPITAADVEAAFAAAVLRKDVGDHWFGGRPDELLVDNGKEFTADDVTRVAMEVGTDVHAVKRYFAAKKGKVERYFRAFQHANLRKLPSYTGNPLSWTRQDIYRNWAHLKKTKDPDKKKVYHGPLSDLHTQKQFLAYMADRVDDHNLHQRPRDLNGLTRWEAWCSDSTPLVEVPRAVLRSHLHQLDDHKIGKQGVEHLGSFYVPTKAEGHGDLAVGQTVSLRTLPHSAPWLEAFDARGKWVDTLKPSTEFSADEIAEREADRQTLYLKAKGHAQNAGKLRRDRVSRIDDAGHMPSLFEVASEERSQTPAPSSRPPAAPPEDNQDARLFTLPIEIDAAVVAGRKGRRPSTTRPGLRVVRDTA